MTIEEARKLLKDKKIVVLYGGWSLEREVSLRSGKRVYDSLVRQGFNAVLLDAQRDYIDRIREIGADVVLIMLHGKPGEDGTFQGALESIGIPYTGSGVLASATGINKVASKRIFQSVGIPTPKFIFVPRWADMDDAYEQALEEIGIPLVIKPKDEGSSLGVHIVHDESELRRLMQEEREKFGDFLIEKYIKGKSVTTGILGTGDEAFAVPVLELRVRGREFYDYEAKYTRGLTEFVIPAELPQWSYDALQEYSLKAHLALECRGFSRVDGVVSEDGQPYILEVNTIPGMTELSDLPAEAEHAGISYDELVLWILKSAYE